MCEVERHEVNGLRVMIFHDELVEDPRIAWDNLTVMACFHRRYQLGDHPEVHGLDADNFNGWAEMAAHIELEYKPVCIKPLYLYDHSGITIRTTDFSAYDSAGWDWGRLGFVWISPKAMAENWPRLKGARRLDKASEVIEQEVLTYDQFLRGEVYAYSVVKPCSECDADGDVLDSCGGFYGLEDCRTEAIAAAKAIKLETVG